jgi:hypothetical protein
VAENSELRQHYRRIGKQWEQAPFVLRITEWKRHPPPVLVVKERFAQLPQEKLPLAKGDGEDEAGNAPSNRRQATSKLIERGRLYGGAQRRILPVLRQVVQGVTNKEDVPLELQRFLTPEGLRLRLNLPLDQEAGAKLALMFRLQERITDLDRTELIARRVARFTREEALYWLSRTTSYGEDANKWAISGLRIVLGGNPRDTKAIEHMLERLRMG